MRRGGPAAAWSVCSPVASVRPSSPTPVRSAFSTISPVSWTRSTRYSAFGTDRGSALVVRGLGRLVGGSRLLDQVRWIRLVQPLRLRPDPFLVGMLGVGPPTLELGGRVGLLLLLELVGRGVVVRVVGHRDLPEAGRDRSRSAYPAGRAACGDDSTGASRTGQNRALAASSRTPTHRAGSRPGRHLVAMRREHATARSGSTEVEGLAGEGEEPESVGAGPVED